MFQHEVFGKSQSFRPCSIRLDSGRIGPIGLGRRPERILTRASVGRQTIPCVAFLEKVHRSSSRSIACFPYARQEQSITDSRQENIFRLL
jgi:hypothetical protein